MRRSRNWTVLFVQTLLHYYTITRNSQRHFIDKMKTWYLQIKYAHVEVELISNKALQFTTLFYCQHEVTKT